MTPEERVKHLAKYFDWDETSEQAAEVLAAIRAAVEEGRKVGAGELADAIKGGFDEGLMTGKALAYEDVIETIIKRGWHLPQLVNEIRARAKEQVD